MDVVRHSLVSLIVILDREASEKGDPTVLGLSILVKTYPFVDTLLFMSDILAQLEKLSLVFQEYEIDFPQVQPLITSCIGAIEGMKTTPGLVLQNLSIVMENLTSSGIAIKTMENADKHFHDNVQVKFCESLLSNLQNRFPDLRIISSFLSLTPIS